MIRWLGGALLCLLSGPACSIERLHLELGSVEAAQWSVQDATLELGLGAGAQELVLHIAQLRLGKHGFHSVTLDCRAFTLTADRVDCHQAKLGFVSDTIHAGGLPASFSWQFAARRLNVRVDGLALAGGKVGLVLSASPQAWQLNIRLAQTGVAGLAALVRQFSARVPDAGYQGSLSGSLTLSGAASTLQRVSWQLETRSLAYDSVAGDQAAEDLQLTSRGQAKHHAGTWQVRASLDAQAGALYSDPLYLEFTPLHPLHLSADFDWQPSPAQLVLHQLLFNQPQYARGSLSGSWRQGQATPLENLRLQLDDAVLPAFYTTWLQPWLVGGVAGKLETRGRLSGRLSLAGHALQSVRLNLDKVTLREQGGVFGVKDLNGTLYWGGQGEARRSTLSWQGARLYKLAFGPAELNLQTQGRHVRMTRPLVVALLDGELHVDSFSLGQDDGGFQWSLDGMLTPVSMQAFSHALGWIPLSGKLSGMVPKMHYNKGELTLGGVLLVQAFDGDITVRNLRIRQPFGLAPRLWADVRIRQVDLETLTRTFDFGRIEGRLDGEVNRLYMEAWQTVAFDAWLKTPRGDRSRHRISQRAVDSISHIGGGGVGGAVSRLLLRFLEDFPYRRLGIRCRLENGVCHMSGVDDLPSGNGYYLVQGRSLPPRLDIIGYTRQVDWISLLDRLRNAGTGRAALTEP